MVHSASSLGKSRLWSLCVTLLLLSLSVAVVSAQTTVKFAGISDYGNPGTGEQSVAALVAAHAPDFVVTAGDNDQIDGTQYDLRVGQYYHSYIGNYTGSYGAGAGTNQFFPSLGNHDVQTSYTAYQNFFTLPGAGILSSNTSGNERYYDFVQGPVHFFMVNANGSEPDGNTSTSTQALWLQAQLAVSTAPWKIVIFHQPPYSSSTSHGSELVMRWPFEAWGADAVFNGHNHVYERVMRDDNSDGVQMPYLTIGLGGHGTNSFGTPIEGSTVRYNASFGALIVDASHNTITFRFHSIDGGGTGTLQDEFALNNPYPDYLETFETFTAGQPVSNQAGWWTDGSGPTVGATNGVAGSKGLNGGQYNAIWTAHEFNWNDVNFERVGLGMDFQTSATGVLDDDRLCWSILNNSTSSDAHFGVQADNTSGGHGIETYWDNISGGSSNIRVQIASLPTLANNAWYRLRAEVTKLGATSARIDVTLHALDGSGNEGALVTSGTLMTDTMAASRVPDPKYFTATEMWPAYKNFNSTAGAADNAYFGINDGTVEHFSLTVNASGPGSVSRNPNLAVYTEGTVVTLTATPSAGCTFDGWSGDLTGSTNPTTIAMNGNKSVTATFSGTPTPDLFTETFDAFPTGVAVSAHAEWDGGGGNVTAGSGVAGSRGVGTSSSIFNWSAHQFDWNDAGLTNVVLEMDFQSSSTSAFDDDRVAWTINPTSTSSDNQFGVQLDNQTGTGGNRLGIVGYWDGTTADRRPVIADLQDLIAADTWYRLRAVITKLTGTSAQIDVTLTQLDNSGNPIAVTATGSIPNTAALGSDAPASKYFVSTLSPSYKNHNTLSGAVDNAHFGINEGISTGPYILTVDVVGQGAVTKIPDQAEYTGGTVVQLTATPNSGWLFTGWSGSVNGTTNPVNVTMNIDKSVTATFIEIPEGDIATIVPFGATWRYRDWGVDLGTDWRATSFNDAGWPSGPARLGFGDVQATTVNGGPEGNVNTTIYFRTSFGVSDPSIYTSLGIDLIRDDGAVIYLNGTEVWRSNMPAGTISYGTWASAAVDGANETATFSSPIFGTSALVAGTNVLAVEVHQINSTSSDLGFNMRLYGTTPTGPKALTLSVVGQGSVTKVPDQSQYTHGTVVQLTAVPNAGWEFGGWSGDLLGTTNPVNVTMEASKTITATFINPDANFVGHWKFDETSGTVANDASSYGNNGVVTGGTWGLGKVGGALGLNGSTGVVSIPPSSSLTFTNQMTFACWMNADVLTADAVALFSRATGAGDSYWIDFVLHARRTAFMPTAYQCAWYIDLNGDSQMQAIEDLPGGVILQPQTWYHIAATYDGTTMRFYVNGTQTASTPYPGGTIPNRGRAIWLGADETWGERFDGRLDDVRIYNRALNASEILALTEGATLPQYTLSVNLVGNGTVTRNPSLATYDSGSVVQLSAIPQYGYAFDGWSGALTGMTNPQNLLMNGNKTVTATFVESPTTGMIAFAGISDYGTNTTSEAQVASLVATLNPDLIVTAGDNDQNDGTQYDLRVGQYYHDYIGGYTGSYGAGSPTNRFFPALGNHDVQVSYTAYQDFFTLPGAGIPSSNTSGNERYYDFVQGPVHFFIINANGSEPDGNSSTSIQAQWLQAQLAVAPEPWKIISFHQPPYSSSTSHGSELVMRWPFEEWGATAVMNGHNHVYERVMRDDNADGVQMPYLTIGLGGQSINSFGTPIEGSVVRYNGNYGALFAIATDTTLLFRFYALNGPGGTIIDTLKLFKQGPITEYVEPFESFTAGQPLSSQAGWWTDGTGPTVGASNGVAGSQGLNGAQYNAIWTAHEFNWNAADVQKIVLGMDFQTSGTGLLDDDRVCWSILNSSTSSDAHFGVQVDNTSGGHGIETYWDNVSGTGSNIRVQIATLPTLANNAWYRLRAEISKLSAGSAAIDVTLHAVDGSGNLGALVASGSLRTDTMATSRVPDPKYFAATAMWPAYKNFTTTAGAADNALFGVSGEAAPTKYTLTVNVVGNGTVTKNPNLAGYDPGAVVQVTANPGTGFEFTSWSGAITGSSNPANITMDANKVVTATFTSIFAGDTTSFVPLGATWRYNNSGTNLGTSWRETGYNDAAWASGPAKLGFGGDGEVTTIDGGPTSARYPTIYFRTSFNVTDRTQFATLGVDAIRDDGVVVYLNGTEIHRDNMPGGAVAYSTLASVAVGDANERTVFRSGALATTALVNGTNVLAVEVHQINATSTDLGLDLRLYGAKATPQPESFVAFNDMNATTGDNNASYVTRHTYQASNAALKDSATGATLGVTVTGSYAGGYDPLTSNGGPANAGTDAAKLFGPTGSVIVDLVRTIELDATNWQNTMTFNNLDPEKEYDIALTSNRNDPTYVNARYTKVTIQGADAFTNASSAGVVVNSTASVSFSTGYNTVNGYVARWTGVKPGADGSFSVMSQWDNAQGSGANNTKGYAMWAFRLATSGPSGESETKPVAQANVDVNFPLSGVVMNFSTLPAAGGNVTITRHESLPDGSPAFPNPPAGSTYLPLWLEITSTMPANSFVGQITVDVSGIPGFGATSHLLCYSTGADAWIPIPGTYDAGSGTFTLTASHFSKFGFVAVAGSAYDLYMNSVPADPAANNIYPNNDWGGATGYEPNDWRYTNTQQITVYLSPQPGSVFGVCNLAVEWDSTVMYLNNVDWGSAGTPNGLFGSGQAYPVAALYDQLGSAGRVTLNCSRLDNTNFTTAAGDHIAALTFTMLTPGYSPVALVAVDMRAYVSGQAPEAVFVTPYFGQVKAYLGDVAAIGTGSTGDGKINFEDLVAWSYSYWSGVSGYGPGMTYYKVKYDIGPTQNGLMTSLPVVDSKIDFEDLVMFSLAYGEYNAFRLPKLAVTENEGIALATGTPMVSNGETRIPVMLTGDVQDVRALSFAASGRFGRFIGAEKGALLQGYSTPVMVMSRGANGRAYVDLAIAGLNARSIAGNGELVVLRFAGSASAQITRADARTSANSSLAVTVQAPEEEIPTVFALDQNYPNPFNPSTKIQFQVPAQAKVEVCVYNLLGEEVATLLNDVREAGVHTVEWNGLNGAGVQVTSGIYFYRMTAGDFVQTKKMLLLK